jgi:hypothetical protein
MQIRRGGVEACLDSEWAILFKLFHKIRFRNQFIDTALNNGYSFI